MNSRFAPKQFLASEWKENSQDLNSFFAQLNAEEKIKCLKDFEFKKFMANNISNSHYASFLNVLNYEETINFVDQEFSNLMANKNKNDFLHFYSFVDKDALEKILMEDFAFNLIDLNSIDSCIKSDWDINLKIRILNYAILNKTSEQVLSSIVRSIYYETYDVSEDKDYSVNKKEILMISVFLNRPEIKNLFFKSLKLLQALDPENRSNLYQGKDYGELSSQDRKNLIKLLMNGYETKLPDEILFNEEFIGDVAAIKDDNDYRMAKLVVLEQNESVYNKIENKRTEFANKYEKDILNSKFEKIENDDVSLDEKIKIIFYKHFKLSLRDTCIKACLIKDAMNSFSEYESKFSEDGKMLMDYLVQLTLSQQGIEDDRKKQYSWGNFVDITKDNYLIVQNIVEILSNKDYINLDNAIERAKTFFVKDVNKNLYDLKEEDLKLSDVIKVYDITKNKKFHLLVHRTAIYDDPGHYKFPQIDKDKFLNTSMSILNNNHLNTYGDDEINENDIVFGYAKVNDSEVVHALPSDSFTNLRGSMKGSCTNKKWQRSESSSAPIYIKLDDFMANMSSENTINEIKLHKKPNVQDKYERYFIKPDYIVCMNKVREIDKVLAKKYNLPIVFIDVSQVSKFSEENYYKPILYQTKASLSGAFDFENEYILQ